MSLSCRTLVVMAVVVTAACAPPPVVTPPPLPTWEEKLADILRLEDARILRDPAPVVAPAVPVLPARGRRTPVPAVAPPPPPPDLTRLVADGEARVRRRAALAIGRVGLPEGAAALQATLRDADPEVRQMAAFALGLVGNAAAAADLRAALAADADLRVRGRAAEALSNLNDTEAIPGIRDLAVSIVSSGALGSIDPDDLSPTLPAAPEAYRLALYALVRLKSWDAVAAATLDARGQPVAQWWPIAYALQRTGDARALAPLLALASSPAVETRAFVARGLGALKDARAAATLLTLADPATHGPRIAAAAVRSLGQLGPTTPAVEARLLTHARDARADDNVRLEAVVALGAIRARSATDTLLDMTVAPWASLRAAAMQALAAIDPDTLITALSGQDADAEWSVRAELAATLSTFEPERGLPLVRLLVNDADARVIGPALRALVRLGAADAETVVVRHLAHDDVMVRAAAASLVAEKKYASAAGALAAALDRAKADTLFDARVAVREAMVALAPARAADVWREGLADPEWAVRRHAADRWRTLDAAADVSPMRPAPTGHDAAFYAAPSLVSPPYSPQLYIDTTRGTIQVELDVIHAPVTSQSVMALARRGYFDGIVFHRIVPNFVVQAGDPRGDGEGGPGYAIRDELSDLPFLRGTVGMALSWPDTGGSQFFITHAPQPHLDGRYAIFGRVVAGMEVVDRLRRWDRIEKVRVWDGVDPSGLR
jgi:cyclophilin family peptidyl-prolyl cis-trans isomerase/HEAT repeat protein